MRQLNIIHAILLLSIIALFGVAVNGALSVETPRGRVTGTLKTADTDRALPDITVTLAPKDEDDRTHYEVTTDAEGRFDFPSVAVGKYRLLPDTQAHQAPEDIVIVQEGKTTVKNYALLPEQPSLDIYQAQNLFTTQEDVGLHSHGFVKATALNVTLYRLDTNAAIEAWNSWLPHAFNLKDKNLDAMDLHTLPQLQQTRTFSVPITHQDIEGVFREPLSFGKLSPGMYLISVKAGETNTLGVITVTNLGLVVKAVSSQVLAYAVDLTTNKPLSGVAISVRNGDDVLAHGQTDENGLLELSLGNFSSGMNLTVVGNAGDSLAVANVSVSPDEKIGRLRLYTYTDRPVYRPGHTVHFRAIARRLRDNTYTVPENLPAAIKVTDTFDDTIYQGKAATDSYGSLSGEFTLPAAAQPGILPTAYHDQRG